MGRQVLIAHDADDDDALAQWLERRGDFACLPRWSEPPLPSPVAISERSAEDLIVFNREDTDQIFEGRHGGVFSAPGNDGLMFEWSRTEVAPLRAGSGHRDGRERRDGADDRRALPLGSTQPSLAGRGRGGSVRRPLAGGAGASGRVPIRLRVRQPAGPRPELRLPGARLDDSQIIATNDIRG